MIILKKMGFLVQYESDFTSKNNSDFIDALHSVKKHLYNQNKFKISHTLCIAF